MASKLYCEFTAQFVLHTTFSLLLSFTFENVWPILQQRNDLSNDRFHASRSHFHVTQIGKAQMRNFSFSRACVEKAKKDCARASWIATSKTKDKFRHWPPLLWGNPDLSCVGVGTLNSENVSHFFAGLVNGVKDVNRMRKSEGKQKLMRECKTRNGAGREFDG